MADPYIKVTGGEMYQALKEARLPADMPKHHDAPDACNSGMDPPFNRRIRHGKLKHPIALWCLGILAGCAIGGGVGAVMIGLLTWAGVVE